MSNARWQHIQSLYHAALEHPASARTEFLREACAEDTSMLNEVQSLLDQPISAEQFLLASCVSASDTPPVHLGQRLGAYEVQAFIGRGGMGEVYRARDTRLGRDVAIKLLPHSFVSDPERRARFEREARVLATLNHPRIGAIYGLEETAGAHALVLELVEGDTLAELLARTERRSHARKGLPLEEALRLGAQIVDALEAAHERGVIHRDLKPANIKITPDGQVKVLDFGLAKAAFGDSAIDGPQAPTDTVGGTRDGMILGTPAYMAPEQAKGKAADRRADIWAFGVILYEMITGTAMFGGETASETMALVMTQAPDWGALPANTPVRVRELLRRVLTKDPRSRLQSIGEARIAIEEEIAHPRSEPRSRSRSSAAARAALPWATAALLAIIALLVWWAPWRAVSEETRTVRFDVFAPGSARIAPGQPLSPDGRTLAFVASSEGTPKIWVRPLDSSAAQPLPGTEGAGGIFWSPDSQYIGFFAQGQLKKVAVRGGPPSVICNVPNLLSSQFASWGTENVVLIGQNAERQSIPVLRVAAAGGQPTNATEFLGKETSHRFPSFLPDGRHFLFAARSGDNMQDLLWHVGSLDSKDRHPLAGLTGILGAVTYSGTGHLVFARGVTLMAQPFDISRFELSGDAVPVAEQVADGPPAFSTSSNGTLAYLSGGVDSELAWFDRTGKPLGLAGPKGHYRNPELSPDGKSVAFTRGQPPDLFLRDVERGFDTRLTSHPAADHTPIWSPDGQKLAFFSERERGTMFVHTLGGMAEDTLLLENVIGAIPADWSRDGQYLVYQCCQPQWDVWSLQHPTTGHSKRLRLTQTPFTESNPRLSPSGRWIAYASDQSGGQPDVYVQSFPEPGLQQQVSTAGGQVPQWSADGKALFYIAPDFMLMGVPVATVGSSLRIGTPVRLFQTRMSTGGLGRNYNVAADGRFLINVTTTDLAAPITVILNWAAGLE